MFNTISGQQNTGGADLPLLISGVQAAKRWASGLEVYGP